jgi:hypothetical protein
MATSHKAQPESTPPEEPAASPHIVEGNGVDPAPVVAKPAAGRKIQLPNGKKPPPPPPPAEAAVAEEPQRKSPFETIGDGNGISPGKRASIFDDLEALRIPPDEDDSDVEEIPSTLAVRRPGKRAFRTRPEEQYLFEAFILENTKEKVAYYVAPTLGKVLVDQAIENLKHVILALCIGKSGKMFFWPIPAKGNFRSSGLMAVGLARDAWIKAVGDLEQGGYQIFKMNHSEYGEPAWPAAMPSLKELLDLAFHDNVILTFDHPELKAAKNV